MIKYILKNYYKSIILIAIFSIICAALTLLLPDILADIISIGIGYSDLSFIYSNGFKLIIISLCILFSSIMASFFSNKMGAKIGYELRKEIYESTINLDENNINKFGVSSLIVRNTHDVNQIQNMISLFFKTIIYTIVLGIGAIFKASIKGQSIPSLAIIVILSILLVAITLSILFMIVIPKYTSLQTKLDKINKRIQEVLEGILVIKVFNKEKYEQNKTANLNKEYIKLEYFLNKCMSLLDPFISLVLNLCTIAIVYIIFKKAINLTDLANMLAFSEYATQVISSFLSIAICFILLPKAFVSYNRIREVTNSFNNIYDNPNAKTINKVESINFNNVYFKYPNSDEFVLRDITLNINKGETIAIIGPTGSGKSTLVNLLNRFYDVYEGSIKINNIDIRNIKLENVNNLIGTVFQNDFIMRGSIKENMLINDNLKIKKAFASACISELTKDLDKEISFDGNNISGGQKQRLKLARTLLKNPQVLILDDATSAIDYKTEKQIIENLKNDYPDLIKIIITSRINSIKNVDKIIVINNGNIIGIGTHKELIKNCPTYKQILEVADIKEDK